MRPTLPTGVSVDLWDYAHFSGYADMQFCFDKPVSKVLITGQQASGSAVTVTYQLYQGIANGVSLGGNGEHLLTNDASATTPNLNDESVYSSLQFSGYGVFRLFATVGANGSSYFNLSVIGVPA